MTLRDLSAPAKTHYLYLLPFGEVGWSRAEIGEKLGFLKTVVQRALRDLHEAELLTYYGEPGPGRVTPFRVLDAAKPPGWRVQRRTLPSALLDTQPTAKATYLLLAGLRQPATTNEVKDVLGLSYQAVYRALRWFEAEGVARHEGENPQRFLLNTAQR